MQETIQLLNEQIAYGYIIYRLKHNYLLEHCEYANKRRHLILKTKIKGFEKIYLVYHRGLFHTFANIFYYNFTQYFPEYRFSEGESINVECLNKAIEEDCILIFIYPDKKMKWIYPMIFKNFAEKWKLINVQQKINTYMKRDNSGYYQAINEVTYSIPFNLLRKFDLDDKIQSL